MRKKIMKYNDLLLDEAEGVDSFLTKVERGRSYFKTGFDDFNERLGGLMPGGLHVIQGRASVGKTTFCKQLADQVHEINPELPVFFFALVDSLETIRAMTFSRLTHDATPMKPIENRLIRRGGNALKKEEHEMLQVIVPRVKKLYGKDYFLVAGKPDTDVVAIRERVLKKLEQIGRPTALVVVDYLQILPAPKGEGLMHLTDRIDYNLHELQCLARDMDGPVILVSSTTEEDMKDPEKRDEREPTKVKGSADILYTPRVVFELAEAEKEEDYLAMQLYVLKNSEGEMDFPICFRYYPWFSKFEEDMRLRESVRVKP